MSQLSHEAVRTWSVETWETLDHEILQRSFLQADRASRAAAMCVCRRWNRLVQPILLHSVNFDVLIALSDDHLILHNHLHFNSDPADEQWQRFLDQYGRYIRVFEDGIYSPRSIDIGLIPFIGLFQRPRYMFPNLSVVRVDIAFLRAPLLGPTVETLAVCIARPLMGGHFPFHFQSIVGASAALREAPQLIPNVRHVRIDGDDSIEEFANDVAYFCSLLPRLETLEITPYGLSETLFLAISTLPRFVSLRVMESGRDGNVRPEHFNMLVSRAPVPEVAAGSFPALREASITARSPSLTTTLLLQPHFPSYRLRVLWIKYSTLDPIPSVEVRTLLRALSWTFPVLEELTLRFAGYGWPYLPGVRCEPLLFSHIRPFLSIARLNVFCIDHTFPIRITNKDVQEMAPQLTRFRCLFLNPYPTIQFVDVITHVPSLEALGWLAESCPSLERLGMLLSAHQRPAFLPVAKFVKLRELFVGWSPIPVYSSFRGFGGLWDGIATYLSYVMDDTTRLATVYSFDEDDELSEMVSSRMRARCQVFSDYDEHGEQMAIAWSAVWVMASLKREHRRQSR